MNMERFKLIFWEAEFCHKKQKESIQKKTHGDSRNPVVLGMGVRCQIFVQMIEKATGIIVLRNIKKNVWNLKIEKIYEPVEEGKKKWLSLICKAIKMWLCMDTRRKI